MADSLTKRTHKLLKELEGTAGKAIAPMDAEVRMFEVLRPLLEHAGYNVEPLQASGRDQGIDYLAFRGDSRDQATDTLGIEYKHFRQSAVGTQTVHRILGASMVSNLSRAMIVTNSRFTTAARDAIRRSLPIEIELMDVDAIRAWASRIEEVPQLNQSEVERIRIELSRSFIRLVANDPDVLMQIEWRKLERMVAEVFEGLGFEVELTPASKDGGKDVILTCRAFGAKHTYYVEVKHWRSGKKVGGNLLKQFVNVVINEEVDGGLFLSTYGYCSNAVESITEIERQSLRLGEEDKLVALCKTFVRAEAGIWTPSDSLSELIYCDTT